VFKLIYFKHEGNILKIKRKVYYLKIYFFVRHPRVGSARTIPHKIPTVVCPIIIGRIKQSKAKQSKVK